MLTYLELDCTGRLSGPKFPDDVWSVIRRCSLDISDVFLFRTRNFRRDRLFRECPEVHPSLFSLGPLAQLDKRAEKTVRVYSFYGGHLNVLFRTHSLQLLRSLVALWPIAAIEKGTNLGLSTDEMADFIGAVSWAIASGPVFAFFQDWFPMLVFGEESLLAGLREFHAQLPIARAP